jgi:hypothetical protein
LTADIKYGAYTIISNNDLGTFNLEAARRDLGFHPTQTSDAQPRRQ